MSASARSHAQAGFTLLEVLVALTILSVAVVSLLELSSQSLRLIKASADYQQAVVLADRLATSTQPSDEAVDQGEEAGFRWERQISLVPVPEELRPKETVPGREPPKLFAVTIDVRWGRDQVLELATLRTPVAVPPLPGSAESPSGTVQPPITPSPSQSSSPATSTPGTRSPSQSTSPFTPRPGTPGMR
jgi:general secretion pathway protein I